MNKKNYELLLAQAALLTGTASCDSLFLPVGRNKDC